MLAFESASFSNFSLLLLLLDCSWDSRMISKSFLWGSFIYTSRNNPLFFWKGQDSWNSTQSQPPLGNPLCSSQNTVRFVKQNQALVKLGCLFLFTSSFISLGKVLEFYLRQSYGLMHIYFVILNKILFHYSSTSCWYVQKLSDLYIYFVTISPWELSRFCFLIFF